MPRLLTFVYCDHTQGNGKTPSGEAITVEAIARIAAAVDAQLNGEVADAWGGAYAWRIGLSDGSDVDHLSNEVEAAIFQHSDVANAAGYHAATVTGQPYLRLFLDDADSLTSGQFSLSVIASHEAIETALDPGANRYATRADGITQDAIEGCDAVEDVVYAKNDVNVSDFLLPSAFDPGAPRPYSFCDALDEQYGTTASGYRITQAIHIDVAAAGHSVQTSAGFKVSIEKPVAFTLKQHKRKMHPASRTARRGVFI